MYINGLESIKNRVFAEIIQMYIENKFYFHVHIFPLFIMLQL